MFLATFKDYRPFLGPGERGVLMIIATDRKQARVIQRYITALLNAVPMLAAMIERQDSESIDLDNRVSIEITTASYRTIRGYTVVAALCDEIAFWRSEDSANPAEEILGGPPSGHVHDSRRDADGLGDAVPTERARSMTRIGSTTGRTPRCS